ncbi:RES family NAD+ phosphorylase [Paenibacillus tyrfis]|uniref:RES family NAD+ phosphorylase n=1 Tax=Paenibacillus tyrfis TaxID=1501230 RepID=UPI0015C689C7|nr:RES family NAD+ phosphorylase [Paenibacillus tyrfis]
MGSLYVTNDDHTEKVYDSFVAQFEENHFFIDNQHELLQYFLSEYEKNSLKMTRSNVFLRGRINEKAPFDDKDLNAPPKGKASAGRLNPKGISYLYAAEHESTVVSELRPWIGATITIATCESLRELKVINLVPDESESQMLNSYRRVISAKFSKPVVPSEKELSYLPTQYIAEYFKQQGYDGLRYSSSVHTGGINYAFFNPIDFNVKCRNQVTVSAIKYD